MAGLALRIGSLDQIVSLILMLEALMPDLRVGRCPFRLLGVSYLGSLASQTRIELLEIRHYWGDSALPPDEANRDVDSSKPGRRCSCGLRTGRWRS
jgi:hypothetical protein